MLEQGFAFVFFKIFHLLLALSGCTFNSLLIYLALFQSPKTIRSYATLIINFALTDFLECALDYFTQARLLPAPCGITLTFILNGACGYFNPIVCYVAASLYTHCISHSVWSLLLSFAYRYYILHHSFVTRKKLLLVLFIIYIPSLLQGATYWSNFVSREQMLPIVQKHYPTYNFSQETGILTGVLDITTPSAAYAILHMSFPITPVYIIIFILRRRIIRYLSEMAGCMSRETRVVHAQLLKVLTIQAALPVFTCIAAIVYFLAQLGLIKHPILEYLICGLVLVLPSISPIIYLIYVRPYQSFCKRLFSKLMCRGQNIYLFENNSSRTGKVSTVAPLSFTK